MHVHGKFANVASQNTPLNCTLNQDMKFGFEAVQLPMNVYIDLQNSASKGLQ
jgi:hypothetical protein